MPTQPIQHPREDRSNDVRRRLAAVEPKCLRTFTPSQAVIQHSAGSYHWTPEGRKLADFTSGVLVANLGHNPARWWQRMIQYLGLRDLTPAPASGATAGAIAAGREPFLKAAPLTAYNAVTELEVRASERLVACLRAQPGGARMEQVLWAASGSEAIQKALWAALANRRPAADAAPAGEPIILATRAGFHGKKGLAGAVTGSEQDPERDRRVRFISFPTTECRDLAARRQAIDLAPYERELNAMWAEYGSRISCLITEPYLGGGGSYHPQPEYLQLLQRFCRQHGILFILDEVQANFGRTGSLFAFTTYGVEPDVVVLGKGLGNGVAVSAAVGPAALFETMKFGEGSDTWSANPLASAAVLATLDEFEAGDVMVRAGELAKVLEAGLTRLQAETNVVASVRGEGVVWGIECAAVGKHAPPDVANALVEACYLGDDRGRAIHLLGALAGKVLRVSPPLVMPVDEARDYLEVMLRIFADVGRKLQG